MDKIRKAMAMTMPLDKILQIKQDVLDLTPSKKSDLQRRAVDFILRTIGIHVLSDCKRNVLTLLPILQALQYVVLGGYTGYYYWSENKITAITPLMELVAVVSVIYLKC